MLLKIIWLYFFSLDGIDQDSGTFFGGWKNSLRLSHLYNSYPKEAFLFQIFQHLSTDFFAFVEAFIIYLVKNASGQVWESFTQFLHLPFLQIFLKLFKIMGKNCINLDQIGLVNVILFKVASIACNNLLSAFCTNYILTLSDLIEIRFADQNWRYLFLGKIELLVFRKIVATGAENLCFCGFSLNLIWHTDNQNSFQIKT